MSFLVVEDNPVQALVLQRALTERQFKVDVAFDGEQALKLGNQPKYEMILLDLELPKIDGLTLLRAFRGAGVWVPVLILSCREDVAQRVEALQAGADDYVCKPFDVKELLARIRALLRRPRRQLLKLGLADLEVDCVERTVQRGSTRIPLGKKEFAILEYLLRNVGRPVSRTMVLEHVWDSTAEHMDNLVDVYISRLRRKIDAGHKKELIHTVRGLGYTIMNPESAESVC